MKKTFVIVVSIVFGLLVASFTGVLTKRAIFEGQRALYTEEQLIGDLADGLPKTLAVLREHFPEDYAEMISGLLVAIKQGGDAQAVRIRGSEVSMQIRRKHASAMVKAPDEQLKTLASANIRLLRAVRDQDGEKICGAVALAGANGIPMNSLQKYFSILDYVSAETFLTIHAGRSAPADHGSVTDADWGEVIAVMHQNGVTEEELGIIGNGRADDARYCGLMIQFLEAVRDHEGDAGPRVRSTLAGEIGAS